MLAAVIFAMGGLMSARADVPANDNLPNAQVIPTDSFSVTGSAVNGTDYKMLGGSLAVPAGTTKATLKAVLHWVSLLVVGQPAGCRVSASGLETAIALRSPGHRTFTRQAGRLPYNRRAYPIVLCSKITPLPGSADAVSLKLPVTAGDGYTVGASAKGKVMFVD